MSCVGQMTVTFHTHYSMVLGVRSHASSDTSFSVCTHTCLHTPYVFIRGWCGCRGEQGFTSWGKIVFTHLSHTRSLPHSFITVLCFSWALFLLCLSLFLSFNSQNMIYPLLFFLFFFSSVNLSPFPWPFLTLFLCPFFLLVSCFLLLSYLFTYIFCSVLRQLNPFLSKVKSFEKHLKMSNCHKAKAQTCNSN